MFSQKKEAETAPAIVPGKTDEKKPQEVKPLNITFYDRAQAAALPVLSLETYAETVRPLALEIERKCGIFHAIPLIQSAHESATGNSRLAREGLNLFGVTATYSWITQKKPVITFNTQECIRGKWITTSRGFRQYGSWMESFEDWASIMTGVNVYKKALAAMRTGEAGIITALLEIGEYYATDPGYSRKLIQTYREKRGILV